MVKLALWMVSAHFFLPTYDISCLHVVPRSLVVLGIGLGAGRGGCSIDEDDPRILHWHETYKFK